MTHFRERDIQLTWNQDHDGSWFLFFFFLLWPATVWRSSVFTAGILNIWCFLKVYLQHRVCQGIFRPAKSLFRLRGLQGKISEPCSRCRPSDFTDVLILLLVMPAGQCCPCCMLVRWEVQTCTLYCSWVPALCVRTLFAGDDPPIWII